MPSHRTKILRGEWLEMQRVGRYLDMHVEPNRKMRAQGWTPELLKAYRYGKDAGMLPAGALRANVKARKDERERVRRMELMLDLHFTSGAGVDHRPFG